MLAQQGYAAQVYGYGAPPQQQQQQQQARAYSANGSMGGAISPGLSGPAGMVPPSQFMMGLAGGGGGAALYGGGGGGGAASTGFPAAANGPPSYQVSDRSSPAQSTVGGAPASGFSPLGVNTRPSAGILSAAGGGANGGAAGAAFSRASPTSASPTSASERASPLHAANPSLRRPGSGESSPMGRFGPIGGPAQHLGPGSANGAEDALAAQMGAFGLGGLDSPSAAAAAAAAAAAHQAGTAAPKLPPGWTKVGGWVAGAGSALC
jgi:hypothetical protein